MKKIGIVALLILAACSGGPSSGDPLLQDTQVDTSDCLAQSTIDQRISVLEDIPEPVDAITTDERDAAGNYFCDATTTTCNIAPDGTETPGSVNCQNEPVRGCGYDPNDPNAVVGTDDYVLVASQVKMDQVVLPNPYTGDTFPSDRQLVRQIFPTGSEYEGKIFRPFCGDWCIGFSGAEGFRGTFYCDFVFHLASDFGEGHELNPNLPPDGSIFDVYIREDAPIPDKVACSDPTAAGETTMKDFIAGFFDAEAQTDNPQEIIQFQGKRWIYKGDDETKVSDVIAQRQLLGTAHFRGDSYDVYQDLFALFGEDFLYFTEPDVVEDAVEAYTNDPSQDIPISFKEFHNAKEVKPAEGGLQLGTFQIPVAATWVRDWVTESKPAIYLYPERQTDFLVKLDPQGEITTSLPTYPDHAAGWRVTALPDGTLEYQGRDYPYLYYESDVYGYQTPTKGDVITTGSAGGYFQTKLPELGLTDTEINDFLNYWQTRLDQVSRPYLFISFIPTREQDRIDPLIVTPQPDTVIRVRPFIKPLDAAITVSPQYLEMPPVRQGNVLVEWGGILADD